MMGTSTAARRTFVVGDIQGCLEPLKCLLSKVNFRSGTDVLWSVGDSVNRGPDSLGTLRFLYAMRKDLVLVLGNHDLHLLAIAAGTREPNRSDTFKEILQAEDRDKMLKWLIKRPLLHNELGYTMVHAGIPPQWTVKQAKRYAREVETVLRSGQSQKFFKSMYGNQPAIWSDDLTGMTRLRMITNYFTRMRNCSKKGELDLVYKGPGPSPTKTMSPWFSHPDRKAATDKILFGHWASINGQTDSPNAIALDTGCVWGGALSFFELESKRWHRCDCPTRKT